MSEKTAIEWTDATWNPIRGCTRCSEGCRFCYAEGIAARFSGIGQPYHGFADRERAGSKWTGRVEIVWPAIDLPLRWRRPRVIFVNSMSDLFHESLTTTAIATIYAVMVAAHHLRGHTLQVLTKRSARMRRTLANPAFWDQVNAEAGAHVMEYTDPLDRRSGDARATCRDDYGPDNPPPGIWLGVSVENQPAADERIADLQSTPAAMRFLSCEPLLGPVDLTCIAVGGDVWINALTGDKSTYSIWGGLLTGRRRGNALNWVIAGGESGHGARPMHPDWPRSLRDQCGAASVPFFFKQWGHWLPDRQTAAAGRIDSWTEGNDPSSVHNWPDGSYATRIGKKAAGDYLDGRQWHEFPA